MERHIFSVTEVNELVKLLLDNEPMLSGICVRGEISNYKMYPSGHHYFSLKDPTGAIRCVMFKGQAMRLRFRPENGMKVLVTGRVSVFPRDGAYQLYCDTMTPEGAGDLALAFEQLKEQLYKEGLFDEAHKKPLPRFPERIAIVTSSAGAAVHDMIRILRRRYPLAKVILLPVRVQGAEAPGELCAAIAWANLHRVADLLITGRGGGSMEDLWAFNDEDVARTIYASEIPVISAVGHEPDVTIVDFVADLRAATPSNAAELAVPDQNECYGWLEQMEGRLTGAMGRRLERARRELEQAGRCRALQDPMNYINDRRMLLDYQRDRLAHGLTGAMGRERERFARLAAALDALSPLKVLGRGYAIPQRSDGAVLRSAKEAMPGETLRLRMTDGKVSCKVIEPAG